MTSASRSSPVILITGCSKGFGRELSALALERGFRVIATARAVETLAALKEKGAEILPFDVTASPDTIAVFAATAWQIYGQVDFLINNAGYLQGGAIEENTLEETMVQFNTNLFGLLNTTNAFLPYFRKRRAARAAVDSLSDTWAKELAEFNVKCISIQVPGQFRTTVAATLRRGSCRIPEYTAADKLIVDYQAASGTELGDPAKAIVRILDFITTEGMDLPLRLPLGDDAYESLKRFYLERLADMEKFKAWSVGTNVD
ncbi:Short-chain dehydrogenase/reductase family protein [Mycena sanguinolenta]|uniref:Short-chain dehydrogenase/reductase family protein n=1 Tax=Mycena sanguinolenta TaxID=230812 RepID=A0A8H6YZD9_9AGAR|nr:Short-chain dehydrogenase/reductase family protein [Mycena sanguinolenta]